LHWARRHGQEDFQQAEQGLHYDVFGQRHVGQHGFVLLRFLFLLLSRALLLLQGKQDHYQKLLESWWVVYCSHSFYFFSSCAINDG
jgi:hypothetical protein